MGSVHVLTIMFKMLLTGSNADPINSYRNSTNYILYIISYMATDLVDQ